MRGAAPSGAAFEGTDMGDDRRTKAELVAELEGLRARVSELEAAEETARDRRFLRILMDTLPDFIYFKDADSRFILSNKAHLGLLGAASVEEIFGKTDFDIFPEELAAGYYADERRIVESGKPLVNREEEIRERDGAVRWVLTTKVPIFDDEGHCTGIAGMTRDFTARRLAIEALRRSEEHLRAILESTADGILVVDEEGRVSHSNGRFAEMWRIPAELIATGDDDKLIGFVLEQLTDPEAFIEKVRTLYGISDESLDTLRFKDGRMFERFSCPLTQDGCVVGRVWSFRDVTDRERARLELERSNAELEQFAYVASHDLQEPLRMVSSFTQLLAQRYSDELGEDGREFIGFAVDGATRMQALINDLLTYSRVDTRAKPPAPTNCEDVFDQAVGILRIAIEESGAVVTHDPLPTVLADATQFGQLFQNLIGNALKFRGEAAPRVHVVRSIEDFWLAIVRLPPDE